MDGDGMPALGALAGQVAADLLARSHFLAPEQVADALVDAAGPLGVRTARIYLADLQQLYLRALPGGSGQSPEILGIDSTAAGRSYQTIRIQRDDPAGGSDDPYQIWLPLLDGTERLGVLELTVAEMSDAMLARCEMLASLAALIIVSKSHYSDTYAQVRRSQPMALQAEMVWAFLAPRTFATDRVLVTATLEPAYEVGGDAYDYSLLGDRLHVSIFDGVGHDLAAGLLASVALASCRSTRRAGGTLEDIAARADHAIARQFGDSRFVTALLCDLDVTTGVFSWIPCGHPSPLLIRSNQVVEELARRPRAPLGLAENQTRTNPAAIPAEGEDRARAHTERLEPGDRILLYTDGVTEARAADGSRFGVNRLTDFVINRTRAGSPAPEMLRSLGRRIAEYQHGRLSDDATILLIEWKCGPLALTGDAG
jgi:serine phosphatase RsbU (regulator of sigma subunit)